MLYHRVLAYAMNYTNYTNYFHQVLEPTYMLGLCLGLCSVWNIWNNTALQCLWYGTQIYDDFPLENLLVIMWAIRVRSHQANGKAKATLLTYGYYRFPLNYSHQAMSKIKQNNRIRCVWGKHYWTLTSYRTDQRIGLKRSYASML